ncbi:MAG: High-affinity zinc uptake system membrane protein ZnuB [Phycisphaerae bacterium]|nr:High-affinity zinc uptake system membrane protein ZnuB [Phycisphaerae bacterium]
MHALVDWLLALVALLPLDWLRDGFMRQALVASAIIAPACAMAGVFVVNMRMAFFSDAIAHSAFAGVALGFLLSALNAASVDPRTTMLLVGLLVAAVITLVKRRSDLSTDTIIGVAFSAVIAAGIAIVTATRSTRDFNRYLYGDLLLLDRDDLNAALLLAAFVLAYMVIAFNRLLILAVNPDLARTRGLATRAVDYSFSLLVALLVTVAIRITGILLVTALLVVPAATARNLARSAGQMFWLAAAAGLLAAVGGLYLAYRYEAAAGATIILVATGLFALSLLVGAAKRR